MKILKIFAFLILLSVGAFAQNTFAAKLQCDGEHDDWGYSGMIDIPVKGIVVEIRDDSVKISGALRFSGTYAIVEDKEESIVFRNVADSGLEGFLKRYSGELSLYELAADKSRFYQALDAKCENARPLF